MRGGIRVSEKHGVNQSMGVCFWCGKEDGTIALLGRLPGDKEAPRRACFGFNRCDDCKAKWSQGIVLVECGPERDGVAFHGAYPTGRWAVIKEEVLDRVFDSRSAESMRRHRIALVEPAAWDHLGIGREQEVKS